MGFNQQKWDFNWQNCRFDEYLMVVFMGLTSKKCDFMGFSFGYQTKFGHLADHADRIETHMSEQ